MKKKGKILRQYSPWLFLLLFVDAFAALLLWIADARAFRAMVMVIVLASILLFFAVCLVLGYREEKRKKAFLDFIDNPDEYHEKLLLKMLGDTRADAIHYLGENLRDRADDYDRLCASLSDYEEYVESWVHEAKTPLSLLTLLLDNHREEFSAHTIFKLDYVRSRMQEFIDQMLYYARIKGTRKDYLFEYIRVRPFFEEVLEDYRPLLDEKRFLIDMQFADGEVYTDKRGFRFLLGQIIANAIKYSSGEPELHITFKKGETCHVLAIRDNGIGVRSCDFPYIFEKGFTGDSGESRKNATGMGLYLVKELADDLMLSLEVWSEWGEGFELQISFPIPDNQSAM